MHMLLTIVGMHQCVMAFFPEGMCHIIHDNGHNRLKEERYVREEHHLRAEYRSPPSQCGRAGNNGGYHCVTGQSNTH